MYGHTRFKKMKKIVTKLKCILFETHDYVACYYISFGKTLTIHKLLMNKYDVLVSIYYILLYSIMRLKI